MNVWNRAWQTKFYHQTSVSFFLLLLHSALKKFKYALVEILNTRLDRESCLSNKYRAIILKRKQYCIFWENILSKMSKQNKIPIWSYLRATLVIHLITCSIPLIIRNSTCNPCKSISNTRGFNNWNDYEM